jgi:type IV pilus assembly protein PilF
MTVLRATGPHGCARERRANGLAAAVISVAAALVLSGCMRSGVVSGKSVSEAANVNMQLAIEYMKLNNLAVAREKLERALKQDPRNPNILAFAGVLYERLGENAKAERYFESAARIGKDDPNVQDNYAGFLCRHGKAEQGEKLFVQVAHNPLYRTPDIALTNAGVCVRGTPAGGVMAEQYFRQALIIQPNSAEALLQLGNLAMERDDAAQASSIVRNYLAANKPSPEFYWLGLRAERKLGNPSGAAVYARKLETEFANSTQAQQLRSGIPR